MEINMILLNPESAAAAISINTFIQSGEQNRKKCFSKTYLETFIEFEVTRA